MPGLHHISIIFQLGEGRLTGDVLGLGALATKLNDVPQLVWGPDRMTFESEDSRASKTPSSAIRRPVRRAKNLLKNI
ncbi:MAG: hypothetical protein Q9212_005585 [Teloschistes hypoglaucus]